MDIFVDNLRTMRESGDPNNFGVEGAMLPLKTCFTPYVCRGAVIFAEPDQRWILGDGWNPQCVGGTSKEKATQFQGCLVGGWATPLKNMKVNWDDYSQYSGKIKLMFQTTNQDVYMV